MKNLRVIDLKNNNIINDNDEILKKMDFIKSELSKIDELLKSNSSLTSIQNNYSTLKNWLKEEHRVLCRKELDPDSKISNCYDALVTQIFTEEFGQAKTNASNASIANAIYRAKIDCSFWIHEFEEWIQKNS